MQSYQWLLFYLNNLFTQTFKYVPLYINVQFYSEVYLQDFRNFNILKHVTVIKSINRLKSVIDFRILIVTSYFCEKM